jgi:CBS domain containing-hemolysin-like protein
MSKGLLFMMGLPGISLFALSVAAAAETLPSFNALLVPFAVIILLVLVNGFFVAAEFAIIGARSTLVEQMAVAGNKTARHVLEVLESRRNQDRYIATAQLGITVASLGLAMYGEPQIAHFVEPYLALLLGREPTEAVIHTVGYVIALSLLTYLHIVLGEMVPKALALTDSVRWVLLLDRPMRLVQKLLIIPVRLLNGIGNLLLRLLRVPPAEGHARVLSPEELEMLVTESAEGGLINQDEEEMIRNIFDFSERLVGQVMTPRMKVEAIPCDIERDALLKLVAESRHSRFPVYKEDRDHIVGILHIKDLARQMLKIKGSFDLRLLLRPAPAVPEDQSITLLLAAFKRQRLHMAIVLDEFGGMAGVVTLEDLVEEVVGEVRDEFDLEKEPYVELGPGVLEVAGEYLVDDLIDDVYLGEQADLPDVETVGGLIVTKLGRPPLIGDEVVYHEQVLFKVIDVDGRAVARARIEYPVMPDGQRPTLTNDAAPARKPSISNQEEK